VLNILRGRPDQVLGADQTDEISEVYSRLGRLFLIRVKILVPKVRTVQGFGTCGRHEECSNSSVGVALVST
jgi:hypothetical protein